MTRIKTYMAVAAFSLLVLGLPAIASAQWGGQNGPYGQNGGYGNGGYGNNTNYGNIRSTVQNLKMRAKNFERMTDQNGRYGNYSNGNIEDLADQFQKAANKFEDKYGRGRNMDNSADEARRVIEIGSRIDSQIYNSRGNDVLQNQWNEISNDLRIIANAYGINYYGDRNNRNNRNNRGNSNGNWRDRLPIRLPF
ncbi:MAG TPA: hypothetical protein PLP07_01095 [Pyrinomonadaceae bacterium]|nr:hypothetical protein [Chloracidobacterium sp.]MBP9935164.1 hypothetical protein [Pyrinomonadaceae bacterium]MBK9438659.1 hypothetical protein [Chloracidobacterium sp.]MBK9766713.1 hypothetical protein [Chloracidobacterium sp.]MBL0241185.1 hypothetical protein [Chloracidobacterium sp.]